MKTSISLFLCLFQMFSLSGQTFTNLGPSLVQNSIDASWGQNGRIFLSTSGGLYTSDDAGDSWDRVDAIFNNIYFHPRITKNKNGNIYLYEHSTSIISSADNGETWTQRFTYIPDGGFVNTIGVYGDTIFIGATSGLKFIYGAEIFMEAIDIPFLNNKDVTAVAVKGRKVIAGTRNEGVFISDDLGMTWRHATPGFPPNFEVTMIEVSGEKLFIGTMWTGVFYSEDWGNTWIGKNAGLSNLTITDLYIDGGSVYTSVTGYQNVYTSSTDASAWTLIDNGIPDVLPAAIAANGDALILACPQAIYKSLDRGLLWTESIEGIHDIFNVSIQEAADGTIYLCEFSAGTFRKKLTDTSFRPFERIQGGRVTHGQIRNNVLPIVREESIRFFDLGTDNVTDEIPITGFSFPDKLLYTEAGYFLSTLQSGIYHLENDTWVEYNAGLESLVIKDFAVHNDMLYAGTEGGLFKASITNNEWSRIEIDASDPVVNTLFINESVMIASSWSFTYVSRDQGLTWLRIPALEFVGIEDIVLAGNRLYASGYEKIYFSDNLGQTWSTWSDPSFHDVFFDGLAAAGSTLYVGALERGILSTPVGLDQTIAFNPITPKQPGDPDFIPDASSSAGLALTFSSSESTVATVVGNQIHIVGAGTTIITATAQTHFSYLPASASQTLTVSSTSAQSISFAPLEPVNVKSPPFAISASATSGLPVAFSSSNPRVATVSGNIVTVKHHGTTVITASQGGNDFFLPATPVSQTLTVLKPNQGNRNPHKIFTAWPNPVRGLCSIRFSDEFHYDPGEHRVEILNAYGQLMNLKVLRLDEETVQIDFTALPAGMYLLSVRGGNFFESFERIIKIE